MAFADSPMSYIMGGIIVASTIYAWFWRLSGSKAGKPPPAFLNKQRQKLKVLKKENISHDTLLIRLALPTADTVLGLPVGKHVKIFCPNVQGKVPGEWNGRPDGEAKDLEIQRSYTPTSSDDERGFVDLVVKVYGAGVVERFPDGGKMSQFLNALPEGGEMELSGPWGMIEYKGRGLFKKGSKEIKCTQLGMIAGGTGITPMLQIVAAIMKDPNDTTQVSLLYANQTEGDILVRDLLEGLCKQHPDRFKVWYTLDRPEPDWGYSTGFITDAMIAEHLPPPGDDTTIVMCGPPPMIKFACQANLDKLGYSKERSLVW